MKTIRIIGFSDTMEDEITISSGEAELICMAPHGRGALKIGEERLADLCMLAIDSLVSVHIPQDTDDKIEKIDEAYAYEIVGTFAKEKMFSCGFEFDANCLPELPDILVGKKISVQVDRIDIFFEGQ